MIAALVTGIETPTGVMIGDDRTTGVYSPFRGITPENVRTATAIK